jgi:murein DD-endopeptidase MepM/ murein hydrolase activator NlpD
MRKHPITGRQTKHRGLDVAGTFPVSSAAPGVVVHIGWSPKGGGHTVVIDHGEVHTAYYHGAHKTGLRVGQRVEAGAFIYTSGTTGASTGVHLHFEVRVSPWKYANKDVDPELVIGKAKASLKAKLAKNKQDKRDTGVQSGGTPE